MESSRSSLARALYLNAALLAALIVVLLMRSGPALPAALAQVPQPIAGGAGLFLMPAQFATGKYGCYVMDVDTQVLVAYEYNPGDKTLRLAAARNFTFDRQLNNHNTLPNPRDIQDLVEKERDRTRARPADAALDTSIDRGIDPRTDGGIDPATPAP